MAEEEKVRKRFKKWCPITIPDAEQAPRTTELVNAYWTAWQAAYSLGREDGIEESAQALDNLAKNWVISLPMDEVQSLNCKQYAKAIRSLSRKSDVQNKREG